MQTRSALVLFIIAFTLAAQAPRKSERLADFVDIAEKAGLTVTNVFDGVDTKNTLSKRQAQESQFSITTTMAGPIFSSGPYLSRSGRGPEPNRFASFPDL
jgi:hypothetical protein